MNEPALPQAHTLRDWIQAASRRFTPRRQTLRPARPRIAQEDWDLLFQAVLDRLERIATEKALPDNGAVRLQAPGTALRECLDALDQLRRSADGTRAR